jgi:uncharacterized membrane protein
MLAVSAALHQLAAIVWVGGMFFAYVVLRPALAEFTAEVRLATWHGVFRRFFRWVTAALVALFATGYLLLFGGWGGFGDVGLHVHLMHGLALVMLAIFVALLHGPWARFRRARAASDAGAAAAALGRIRRLVALNLTLGLVTAVLGASGRWWGAS